VSSKLHNIVYPFDMCITSYCCILAITIDSNGCNTGQSEVMLQMTYTDTVLSRIVVEYVNHVISSHSECSV
jgi:hypothetical protein